MLLNDSCRKCISNETFVSIAPESVEEGFRPVSLAGRVMGITGIETSDVIYGIIEKTNPDFVIAIDDRQRSIERVNSTIQISDTGIHPIRGWE